MEAQLTKEQKAYIAGFLDGDGCIMFQNVYRKDYVFGYQIRASVVFYQKTKHRQHLDWLNTLFSVGYVRERNDGMTEYTIVGLEPVMKVLEQLEPHLRLKKSHVQLARNIMEILSPRYSRITPEKLLKASRLVDKFTGINYSKKRTNTSAVVEQFLREKKFLSP